MGNTYCSLLLIIVIMMLALVVSDPLTPYPYYDESNNSNSPTPFPVPPSLPNNSQSPNLAKGGRKNSPPPSPSKLPPPPPPAVHFDFFKLVERWPKTFCYTETCRNDIKPKFEIHGFWPSIQAPSASQPEFCEKSNGVNFYKVPLNFHCLFIII
jgi:hypothetical protein